MWDVHRTSQRKQGVWCNAIRKINEHSSAGRFVTVTFTKKSGELRTLNGRLGVTKGLSLPVGEGHNNLDKAKFITIWDMKARGYRAINREAIVSVTVDHQHHG